MSFLSQWFKRKKSDDYESVLQDLQLDIDTRQTRLSEIRLRERRSTLAVTIYTLLAWSLYLLLWYIRFLPEFHPVVKGLPVFLGPILILFSRRIVQLWYSRKGRIEEKHLKALLTKQRTTIEDIKAKTNYYSTRSLLERYDDQGPQSSPLRRRQPQNADPSTPGRAPSLAPVPQTPQPQLAPGHTPNPLSPIQQPIRPPKRQWYDRLADAVLGEEDPSLQSHTRYALICQKCFTHNGLVRESEWETTQYRCPKCNFLNTSPRSKKEQTKPEQSAAFKLPDLPQESKSGDPAPQPASSAPSEPPRQDDGPTSMDVDTSISL